MKSLNSDFLSKNSPNQWFFPTIFHCLSKLSQSYDPVIIIPSFPYHAIFWFLLSGPSSEEMLWVNNAVKNPQ